jgi:hypothetical protein
LTVNWCGASMEKNDTASATVREKSRFHGAVRRGPSLSAVRKPSLLELSAHPHLSLQA